MDNIQVYINWEYEWIYSIFKKLVVPYECVLAPDY